MYVCVCVCVGRVGGISLAGHHRQGYFYPLDSPSVRESLSSIMYFETLYNRQVRKPNSDKLHGLSRGQWCTLQWSR